MVHSFESLAVGVEAVAANGSGVHGPLAGGRVFDAVLEQDVPWRRLGGSALCAFSLLGVLLVAVATGARHSVQEHGVHVDPVVTFLDAPAPPEKEAVPDRSISAGGASGAASDELSSGAFLNRPRAKTAIQKPERVAALADRARETVADEAPKNQAATPAPLAMGGNGRANEGPSVPTLPTATALGAGSPNALGNGVGGGGGTGNGNGSGAGNGVGPGVQTANTGGRFGVLPFGEGMSRPVLQTKIDPTYTQEAASARVQGVMLVKCVLTAAGSVQGCRIVKGLPMMNDAVLAAVSRWRYSPVTYQGQAVAVDYLITLHLTPP